MHLQSRPPFIKKEIYERTEQGAGMPETKETKACHTALAAAKGTQVLRMRLVSKGRRHPLLSVSELCTPQEGLSHR